MKQVKQTKFGSEGNCFQACLASILELPIESIPHVDSVDWLKEISGINEWLIKEFDCYYVEFDIKDVAGFPMYGFHFIAGESPRSKGYPNRVFHSVVGYKGKIVFDPHPDGTGLKDIRTYGVLVPVEPQLFSVVKGIS